MVDNASGGPVNISNIAVDATGHQVTSCTPEVVGIFYQNSAGTVNQVDIRNQKGSRCGVGFWAEGGSALPSVTFANSNVHDVDFTGITTETNATTSELNATIKGNYVNVVPGSSIGVFGILIRQGSTGTVSGNVITSGDSGIIVSGSTGSVSGNTVINTQTGINADSDGASVTNNKVFNSAVGIEISTSVAAIQNNIISNSTTGMEFSCFADTNATHNIINEAQTGIRDVPASLSIPNTYSNVGAIRTGC